MAVMKKSINNTCWGEVEKMQIGLTTVENSMETPQKTKK